jgi:hypothetical protein
MLISISDTQGASPGIFRSRVLINFHPNIETNIE